MGFYDEDWARLLRRHPLIAKKIEELHCESVGYEQYEEESKIRDEKIARLERLVNVLLKTNGLKEPVQATT